MNYDELKNGLSSQKLNSYKIQLNCNNNKELIASYMVLQGLQEKFYLPIQLVEITLRNNINNAIYEHLKAGNATDKQANRWYNTVPSTQYSKIQVKEAKIKANKEVKNRGANHNDVIARLTFGFWVYLLNKPHRLNGEGNKPHQLWPFLTDKVFPNRGSKGIPELFNDLNTLNKLRNRLFHHEPIWSGVSSKKEAIDKLEALYQFVIDILGCLSADKLLLVNTLGVVGEFKNHCTLQKFIDYENLLP